MWVDPAVLGVSISNELSSSQLEQLKFLLRDKNFGKKVLENIDNGLKLFELMKERNYLAADKTELLSNLLKDINRQDLAEKINNFIIQPDPNYEKLKTATEVIAENLGKNWRKLGRKLGLTETRLDSISTRHPSDLQETAMELLKEWRKDQRADAQVKKLIDALRACQMNLTADKVEKKICMLPPRAWSSSCWTVLW
uniref:Fas (tnfrsf6)-associated via death domain n=1 Tax=Amphilophus citrinellus TaxID=61819 RepID=A0A3Q0QTB4_AMPCI